MIIKYIDKCGNIAETEDLVKVPANLEKIGNMCFEKKEVKKIVVEAPVIEETPVTTDVENTDSDETIEDLSFVELQRKAKALWIGTHKKNKIKLIEEIKEVL